MNFYSKGKTIIQSALTNRLGTNVKAKYLVIESDDWGSIRMPNKQVREKALSKGILVNKSPYTMFDTIASEMDLNALFAVLLKYKDNVGNHPKVTFNTVSANPNFGKIEDGNYESYYFEPFIETINSYYPNSNVFDIWKQGIKEGVIFPQFHGREHVNVSLWLSLLGNDEKPVKDAFDLGFWGIPYEQYKPNSKCKLQATYDANNVGALESHGESLVEGLKLFREIFDFPSRSFIPNNFIFDKNKHLKTLKENCVDTLQGMKYHINPIYNNKSRSYERRSFGFKNGMLETIRNCVFEPSQEESKNGVVEKCLTQIENAFMFNKPAIITAHRLNFIGSIDESNRRENLKLFDNLLNLVLKKWPDVEFLNSAELSGKIY